MKHCVTMCYILILFCIKILQEIDNLFSRSIDIPNRQLTDGRSYSIFTSKGRKESSAVFRDGYVVLEAFETEVLP